MKKKRGMSLISLGIMVILIIMLAVLITMLFMTALKNNVNNLEQTPGSIDQIMGI